MLNLTDFCEKTDHVHKGDGLPSGTEKQPYDEGASGPTRQQRITAFGAMHPAGAPASLQTCTLLEHPRSCGHQGASRDKDEEEENNAGVEKFLVLSGRIHFFTANLANGDLFPWSRPASDGFTPGINGGGPPSPGGWLCPFSTADHADIGVRAAMDTGL